MGQTSPAPLYKILFSISPLPATQEKSACTKGKKILVKFMS